MFDNIRKLLYYIDEIPCRRCGCRNVTSVTKEWINNVEAEIEFQCAQCGAIVNRWAYGAYESPFTYTETFEIWLSTIIRRWRNKKWR